MMPLVFQTHYALRLEARHKFRSNHSPAPSLDTQAPTVPVQPPPVPHPSLLQRKTPATPITSPPRRIHSLQRLRHGRSVAPAILPEEVDCRSSWERQAHGPTLPIRARRRRPRVLGWIASGLAEGSQRECWDSCPGREGGKEVRNRWKRECWGKKGRGWSSTEAGGKKEVAMSHGDVEHGEAGCNR